MIRPATLDDLAEIMRLEQASFPSDAWSEPMMREELSSPHGHYLVLETAGRLGGYAGLRAVAGASDGDVQTIAVAEHARGRGNGRRLLRALLEIAEGRQVRDVFLEVRDDNPVAQALYVSEGFVEVGRRPRYYQPDDVDAIVMRLDVRSWAGAVSTTQADRPDAAGQTPAAEVLPELRAPGGGDVDPAGAVSTTQADRPDAAGQTSAAAVLPELRAPGSIDPAGARTTAGTGWC